MVPAAPPACSACSRYRCLAGGAPARIAARCCSSCPCLGGGRTARSALARSALAHSVLGGQRTGIQCSGTLRSALRKRVTAVRCCWFVAWLVAHLRAACWRAQQCVAERTRRSCCRCAPWVVACRGSRRATSRCCPPHASGCSVFPQCRSKRSCRLLSWLALVQRPGAAPARPAALDLTQCCDPLVRV